MRIRLEATQGELEQRSDVLVEQLCKALEAAAPDTAAILRKAIPEHEKAASAPVLQTILKKQRAEYARLNKMMLDEILKVLERAGAK